MKKLILALLLTIATHTAHAGSDPSAKAKFDCQIKISNAESQLNEDNTVDDEPLFLKTADDALHACEIYVAKNRKVLAVAKASRAACIQSSDQSSILYHGTCLLKAADLVDFLSH